MKLEMNDDIRTEWVKALRSGQYEQGDAFLHKGDKFCCLGVLCDLAVKAGVIPGPEVNGHDIYYYHGADTVLPESVGEWAGLDSDEGEPGFKFLVKVGDEAYGSLAAANDSGRSFAELADAIEGDSVVPMEDSAG